MVRPITFLSDYGLADEFAGVCRAVIHRIAPDAEVIDLTHGIPRHDVPQGAAVLANALPYCAPGVHLAVVDPGVGTSRKAVMVRTREDDRILVGPDNGLLAAAIERFGGAAEAFEGSLSKVRLEPVSATFHGRDVFAPLAAHAALGTALDELGDPFDPGKLAKLELPTATVTEGRVEATVAYLDRFGNAALSLRADDVLGSGIELGHRIEVQATGAAHDATYLLTFADVASGALLLYRDAYDSLALAVNRGSAADRLRLSPGDRVVLRPK